MAPPRSIFPASMLLAAVLLCGGCNLRLLPQSASPHEARLDKDGLKLAVRVTKKGFCLGYLAVFHGEDGADPGKAPPQRCTEVPVAASAGEGAADLTSLSQFLTEAQQQRAGGKVRVVIEADPDAAPEAVRRVKELVRGRAGQDAKQDGLSDFVISESAD